MYKNHTKGENSNTHPPYRGDGPVKKKHRHHSCGDDLHLIEHLITQIMRFMDGRDMVDRYLIDDLIDNLSDLDIK